MNMSKPKSEVFNIDCMEYMATMPDKYFDLAIVDPPYGIGADKPTDKSGYVLQPNGSKLFVASKEYTHKKWDIAPSNSYFKELDRVAKRYVIWGCNFLNIPFSSRGRLVWDKMNNCSDQQDAEIAYVSFTSRVDLVYYMWAGMMQGARCSRDLNKALLQLGNKRQNEVRIHPTQKPVKLYSWMLRELAIAGDKILDTHLGSGPSRIASYKLGFDFTACESDKDYFEAQEIRFKKECLNTQIISNGRELVQTSLF